MRRLRIPFFGSTHTARVDVAIGDRIRRSQLAILGIVWTHVVRRVGLDRFTRPREYLLGTPPPLLVMGGPLAILLRREGRGMAGCSEDG